MSTGCVQISLRCELLKAFRFLAVGMKPCRQEQFYSAPKLLLPCFTSGSVAYVFSRSFPRDFQLFK